MDFYFSLVVATLSLSLCLSSLSPLSHPMMVAVTVYMCARLISFHSIRSLVHCNLQQLATNGCFLWLRSLFSLRYCLSTFHSKHTHTQLYACCCWWYFCSLFSKFRAHFTEFVCRLFIKTLFTLLYTPSNALTYTHAHTRPSTGLLNRWWNWDVFPSCGDNTIVLWLQLCGEQCHRKCINSKITSASNRTVQLWLPIFNLMAATVVLLRRLPFTVTRCFLMLCASLCPVDDCRYTAVRHRSALAHWVHHSRIQIVIIHRFVSLNRW